MKYYAATAAGLAILCALLLTPARAAAAGRSAASPSPADRADLSAFFDGTIPGQLAAGHIPGAAVSVVKDGELVFSGGYGLADTDRQIPVAAERTLFRVGSITKLFTWTAVMQLAEQGRVNLDADICSYLPAGTIANTWPAPVTLANLLTHTGGFEDRGEGLFIRDVDLMIPLSEYVARFMPTRVRAPGITMGYSNFGAALAGYIVERVSGIPYERYIEENILTPLGMSHSSIRQPLPQDLATDLAVGYRYADSKLQQQPEWIQGRPAGALSATAVDMASFMIAHLQQGRRGEVSILREETVRDMQRTHFAQDARASGWTWGFMEMSLNGLRLVWHGGATYVFHSALVLVPEENLGIFVAYNGQGGMVAHQALLQAFMDRYYPVEAPAPSPSPRPLGDSAHLARYAGTYRGTNHMNVSTIEKMFALFSAVPVRVTERGTLAITGVTMAWPAVVTRACRVIPS